MRGDAEPAEPGDVLRDRVRVAAERIRRLLHAERDVVTVVGADFDAVDAQHAVKIFRRRGGRVAVAMVGEDRELQSRACRRARDRIAVERAVGSSGVNVIRAGHDPGDRAAIGRARSAAAPAEATTKKTTAATRAAVSQRLQ